MSTQSRRIGQYELQEQLGRGSMAEVWKAFDLQLHRDVAIKLLHTNLQEDSNFIVRFEREARFIASLHHPNIVPVHDFQIAAAPAQVAGQVLLDLVRCGIRVLLQEGFAGQDEARCAETALQSVAVHERLLHRREPAVLGQALDGGDLRAFGLHREHETRAHGTPVDDHGACAAHAVFASEVRAGEATVVAEKVGERLAGLDGSALSLTVDGHAHDGLNHGWSPPG